MARLRRRSISGLGALKADDVVASSVAELYRGATRVALRVVDEGTRKEMEPKGNERHDASARIVLPLIIMVIYVAI